MADQSFANIRSSRSSDDRPNGARNIGALSGAKIFRGAVNSRDRVDYYSFSLSSRSSFNLLLNQLQNNVDVSLLQGGKVVSRSAKGGKKPETINRTLEAGTYFIRINQRTSKSKYKLTLNATPTVVPNPPQTSRRFLSLFGSASGTPTIGTIDLSSGTFSPLPNSTRNFTDLAAFGTELFGVTLTDSFYKVDPNTGTTSFVGNLDAFGMNALDFAASGTLYGASGSKLYTIDTATGKAKLVANIPGFLSSGDLAYDGPSQRFFATSKNSAGTVDTLYSIGLTGDAQRIGDIGFNNVFGIFVDGGRLYGYTADRQQIVINATTGVGSFNRTVTGTEGAIGGAA